MEREYAVLDWIDFHWWKLSQIFNVDITFTGESSFIKRMPNYERWFYAPTERMEVEYQCLLTVGRIL